MLAQQKPFMRALRRNHTSSSSSPSSSSPSSSSSSSWIHLRSVFLVVGSSSSSVSTTNRGSIKSPWSRRRRKHALLPKQWEILFDKDGRLCDGGVKFLKKVRSGGVDPSLRAEVWPFLLGVYDLNSSKEERDSVGTQNRKEYENLRRQCKKYVKQCDKSIKLNETSGNNSNDDSGEFCQVPDSPALEDDVSPQGFLDGPSRGDQVSDHPALTPAVRSYNMLVGPTVDDNVITQDNASEPDSDSSDSESSEESDTVQPFFTPEKTDKTDFNDHPRSKSPMAEDLAMWQRIIRLDAIRANAEWVIYSPSQAAVSAVRALRFAQSVGLKDYDHLEPCRIFHAARLVSILEAYALYDPEIGYCQGMSDLLSPIISVINDDHIAFWCFVGFMRKARHNFRLDEAGIRRQLNIVSKIIKGKDCHLYRHLEKFQAEDCFFVYRMVVVLFRRELNFEQTLCLWEVMWADQAAIRAGIAKSAWGRMRLRAPPTDDLLLYAIAACVLQRRKLIIEKYSSMDEILRECNSMAGNLDVWKLLDDAHDLVVTLHDKI
ncbi:hypothetical protein LguiA_015836 [Lonicera macranthoides]